MDLAAYTSRAAPEPPGAVSGRETSKKLKIGPGVAFSATARGGRGRECKAGAGQRVGRVHLATTLTTHPSACTSRVVVAAADAARVLR
eukprot:3866423-Prymnesium_polylepis.1